MENTAVAVELALRRVIGTLFFILVLKGDVIDIIMSRSCMEIWVIESLIIIIGKSLCEF
ncbi:MAG: hypothetical protein ACD_45C00332G0003 [uncultured bacterium]|nr:MAG: hypothetical protein ACD_45C00332G0003 [uncultured bacterium]